MKMLNAFFSTPRTCRRPTNTRRSRWTGTPRTTPLSWSKPAAALCQWFEIFILETLKYIHFFSGIRSERHIRGGASFGEGQIRSAFQGGRIRNNWLLVVWSFFSLFRHYSTSGVGKLSRESIIFEKNVKRPGGHEIEASMRRDFWFGVHGVQKSRQGLLRQSGWVQEMVRFVWGLFAYLGKAQARFFKRACTPLC